MNRRILPFLVGATLLCAGAAHANRQTVWYDDTNRPWSSDQTQDDFVRAIQQVLREYETQTQGAAIFEWGGVAVNPPCGGNNLTIVWDPTLPSNICAQTYYYYAFNACPQGRVAVNPNFGWRVKWMPNAVDVCVNFQATLAHEMAHWMKQVDNSGHINNSVLTQVVNARDLIARHLWNHDTQNINFSDWFFKITFGQHNFVWRTEWYDVNTGNTGFLADGTQAGDPIPLGVYPTEALSPGANGNQYALATGSPSGLKFVQGSGRSWGGLVNLTGTEQATTRRLCLATNAGQDIYLVWSSANEGAASAGGTWTDGGRAIFFSQSHNGGASWSAARVIPYTYTRSGVSCTFDRANNAIVLAYQGAGEEGIWTAARSTTSTVLDGWSTPVMLSGPRTPEVPHVAYDPFTSTANGWISWFDSVQNVHLTQRIARNGSGNYVLTGASQQGLAAGSRLVRSAPVQHMAFGASHVAYSLNEAGGVTNQQRRTRGHETGTLLTGNSTETSVPGPINRYSGAAENSLFLETMLGSHGLLNPN